MIRALRSDEAEAYSELRRAASPAAQALYERFGFRVWGKEPDALLYGGRSVLDHHMLLVLE